MSQNAVLNELKAEQQEIENLLQMLAQRIKSNDARRNTMHTLRVELSQQLSAVEFQIAQMERRQSNRAVAA